MAERDQDLVQRTLNGQRQAFADLVERYSGLVHGIVLESVRRPEVVEDLVQEVFCEAYERLPSLRRPERFSSWLYSVAANRALDWLRLQQRRSASSPPALSLAAPSRSPEELYEAREREEVVWAALDRLPPEQRRVAVLHYLEGCTHQEIAHFLGLTAAMVKWRLRQARRSLKQELFVAHYQSSSERARTRQQVRNQVMAVLPLVACFEVGSAGGFLARYGRRLALSLGLTGALGLAGLATRTVWLPLLTRSEIGQEVIQKPAGRPTTPAVITLRWEPACPRAGQRVRVEASGVMVPERGIAYLHIIASYRYPLDQVQPMALQQGVWTTQVEIPTAAANLFLYVSSEAAPQRFEEGLSAVQEQKLRQYSWGLMVHDEQGRPCRGAEMGLAQMAILQGLPREQGLAHLEREITRYPDNFEAYLMRWGTRFRSLPAAERVAVKARNQAELTALEQQYPNQPELLYETASYAADSLADLARHYERIYQRFPQYEKAAQAAFNAAVFYSAAGDTAAALVVLEDFSRRFPRSPWREEIYRRRLSLLAQADPPRVRDLADSLISGALVVPAYRQPELRRWTPALFQTGILPQSRAYTLRLDQCLAAGDTAGALALAQRLIAASLPDPFPYLYAGQRLRRLGRPALPVLEAGLAQATVERLLSLPGIPDPWSADLPAPLRAHHQAQDRERAVVARVQYLLELGECSLEAGQQALAATRLREADKLVDELVQLDPPEEVCLSLGQALARAGQGEVAERSLSRLVWFYYCHPEAELELARIHQARYGHTRFLAQRLAELWPQAPPFALVDVLGESVSLAGWAGRPILIYCGNPGEGPRHQAELAALDRWQRAFGPQGLEVLYVSHFGDLWAQGRIWQVTDWLRQVRQQGAYAFHFTVDEEDALRGYPLDLGVLLLIDRSGRLRLRWWYERWATDAGQQQVAQKLSEVIAEHPGPALSIGGNP